MKKMPVAGARVLLFVIVLIWGGTFPVLKALVASLPPALLAGMRFTMGALGLWVGVSLPVSWLKALGSSETQARMGAAPAAKAEKETGRRWSGRLVGKGMLLGFFLGLAYLAQTTGLVYTSASKAGFLTGLFVVFTPFFEWAFFGRQPSSRTWGAVILATFGLWLLSTRGTGWQALSAPVASPSLGDWIIVLSALCYSVQLALAGRYAREEDPLLLSTIEISTVASLGWAAWLLFCVNPVPGLGNAAGRLVDSGVPGATSMRAAFTHAVASLSTTGWLGLFYLALPATTFALAGQLYGQRFVPAAEAAVIFALEPVFGAAFAFLFLGERLTLLNLIGAAAMLASSVMVSLPGPGRDVPRGSKTTASPVAAGR